MMYRNGMNHAPGRAPWALALGLCTASLGACTGEIESVSSEATTVELGLGSEGPQVRALNEFLTTYGYFPNAELDAAYPGYEPVVDQAPASANIYDEHTVAAVQAYQRKTGLTETGVADAETLALTQARRCRHPDGVYAGTADRPDPDALIAKWSVSGRAPLQAIKWRAAEWPAGFTQSSFSTYFQQNVINEWQKYYPWAFTRVSSGEDLRLVFNRIDGPGRDTNGDGRCDVNCGAAAQTNTSTFIEFDEENWSFNGQPTTNTVDFVHVALHEMGHVLGLKHTAEPAAIMYSTRLGQTRRARLHADDRVAIRVANKNWRSADVGVPLVDVAARGSAMGVTTSGNVCSISQNLGLSGCVSGVPGTPKRLAMDPKNRPWVVNTDNEIHVYVGARWQATSGCARDIAMSKYGRVFMLGCNRRLYEGKMPAAASNATLQAQLGAGWKELTASGTPPALENLSAGTLGGRNEFAVLATDVYGVTWVWGDSWFPLGKLLAPSGLRVTDLVASNDAEAIWGVAKNGTEIVAMNIQSSDPVSGSDTKTEWTRAFTGTGFTRVAAWDDGRPLVLGANGRLWTTRE